MADYIAILDAQIEPKAPVTSELMNQLRDNPLAMFEGATGAPRLQTAGIEDDAVTLAKLNITSTSASGAISSSTPATVTINRYSFDPALTLSGGAVGTIATAAGGNNPRYLISTSSGSATYAIRWDYLS